LIRLEIKSKLAHDVLMRAIDKELESLRLTMLQCDTNDAVQYEVFLRAKEQHEELLKVKDDVDQ
jgi:hypothetical protein